MGPECHPPTGGGAAPSLCGFLNPVGRDARGDVPREAVPETPLAPADVAARRSLCAQGPQ